VSGIVLNVIPQPFLIFEQQPKSDGDLPVLIALVCATSATTRSMTDFQCGGSAWRHY